MSVVAWDGKCLAADMQASCQALKFRTRKMRRGAHGIVYAWTGPLGGGQPMVDWHDRGARSSEYPEQQKADDRWCRLIVATIDLKVVVYEQTPAPCEFPVPWAWGSGMESALGALAMGATAKEAVETACRFSIDCGMGVSVCRPGPYEDEDLWEEWDERGSPTPEGPAPRVFSQRRQAVVARAQSELTRRNWANGVMAPFAYEQEQAFSGWPSRQLVEPSPT